MRKRFPIFMLLFVFTASALAQKAKPAHSLPQLPYANVADGQLPCFLEKVEGQGINAQAQSVAVDSLSSIPFQTTITPAACQPTDHIITTQITNPAFITVAQVMFSVNGSFFQGMTLQPVGNQYTATIPAQNVGAAVTWYIRTVGLFNYQTASASYVDGLPIPKMRTQVGSNGSSIQINSRVAIPDTSVLGFGGHQVARGINVQFRSNTYLEINSLLIGLADTTSIEIYEAKLPELGGIISIGGSYVKIASVSNAVPSAGGFAEIPLSTSIRMAPESVSMLYILAGSPTALRISPSPYFQQQYESNLNFYNSWITPQPFTPLPNQLAWPVMKVPVESLIDSLEWFLPSAPNAPIGTSNTLSVTIGNQPTTYGLRFYSDSCVLSETFTARIGQIDWGMEALISPTQWNEVLTDPVRPQVALRNNSTIAARAPKMQLLANGQVLNTFMWPQEIPAGDSIWVFFPPTNLQAQTPGITLCAVTLGDQNAANDTSCRFIPAPNSVANHGLISLQLYPNPAKDWVKIRWESPLQHTGTATILDLTGRVVLRENLSIGTSELTLSTTGLAPSTYMVQVQSRGVQYYERLILQP